MATLKDVAKEAGLTVTTVSRVLNNRGYISEDARNKVNAAMEKLHYQPNEVARSLHAKSSNTIGLIVPHIKHPYFACVISAIEKEAYQNGYRILLCNSQDIKEKEDEYINICRSNRVAGLILFSATVDVAAFKNLDIPVITMERFLDSGTASVECDNEQGGELAAKELIECGCKKVLLVGSTRLGELSLPADKRSYAFDRVCKQEGIEVVEVYPDNESYNQMDYSQLLRKSLENNRDIDGVFASSDVIAAQTVGECIKMGLQVPGDVKVIGFDDTLIARVITPSITTIHQPIEEMAELAIRLLRESNDGKLVPRQSVLPVRIVKRESTGRI